MAPSSVVSPTKKPDAPSMSTMVEKSIAALKERGGSSRAAIKKNIISNYKVKDDNHLKSRLSLALKKLVRDAKLEMVKASYRLTKGGSVKSPKQKRKSKIAAAPAKAAKAAADSKGKMKQPASTEGTAVHKATAKHPTPAVAPTRPAASSMKPTRGLVKTKKIAAPAKGRRTSAAAPSSTKTKTTTATTTKSSKASPKKKAAAKPIVVAVPKRVARKPSAVKKTIQKVPRKTR